MTQPQHIRYYDLATLKRWNRNYRQGDVGAIIQSIARFGFNGALRVWRDDVVIAGNHALMALLQMKASAYQTPRGIVEHDGKWLIPCVDVSHLSEIEAEAYAIADNRTQERGDNDNEQLAALLSSIAAEDAALLAATGYDGDDVDALLAELGNAALGADDPGAQIDRAEELQAKWQVQRGDVWQIGAHRLMCGDSTNADDVMRLMGGGRAEMVWTDPPYGVSVGDKNKMLNAISRSNRVEENLKNDTLEEPELLLMLERAFDNAIKHCSDGGAWYVAAPAGPLHVVFGMALKQRGIWRQTIQWVKNNATFSPLGVDYHWQAEPIFYGWLPTAGHRYYGGRQQTTVWNVDRPTKSPEHPTMKPPELVVRAIENSSKLGELVLDVFSGSGTTLVACEQTGRRGYGMEIEPKYCAVTLERLAGMGLTPELVNGVHTKKDE